MGSSAAPPRSGRIQPDQLRRLLLVIRPARPSLAEVPLADLSFAENVGLDHHLVAADPLDREAASIHLRPHAIDHHSTSELIGEFHGSFPARLPGLLLCVAKV